MKTDKHLMPPASRHSMDPGQMPWGPLLRLVVVTTMMFCSMAVITPTLNELVRNKFHLDQRGTSMFMLVHSLPQILLLGLLAGLISDRWGRRVPLALAGCFGTGITTMLLPFPSEYSSLLALRFLDGALGIVGIGMLMTRALDLCSPQTRSRVMAVFMTSIPAGYLLGSALTLLLGMAGAGINVVYGIAGGGLALAALLLLWEVKRPENVTVREPGARAMIASLRGVPRLWLPIMFGFVDKFSFALLAILPALVLKDRYGLTGFTAAGAVMTAFWIMFAGASGYAGTLTSRIGAWRAIAVSSVGYGLCLSLAVVFDFPWMFLVFIGLAGLFTGLKFVANLVLVGQMVKPDEKATAISAFNLMGSFGLLLGFVYAGVAGKIMGYAFTFASVGAVEIGCGGLAWILARRNAAIDSSASTVPRDYADNHASPIDEKISKIDLTDERKLPA